MMDTMLGSNDAAPFRVPGVGDVTRETEFAGDDIPQYWQAFDSLASPNVVSYGNFISGAIRPAKVQFTNWRNVYSNRWNYIVSPGSSNGDSAVSIIWERYLAPGMEETYVTRYGLSELLQDLRPPLSVTVAADSMIQVDSAAKDYVPYLITAYIQNTGDAAAVNAVCNISLPTDLRLQPGDSLSVPLGDIAVGDLKKVEKKVYVKEKAGSDRNVSYSITVSADNCLAKTLRKELVIPGIEIKGIIVIPGIAGSRLETNNQIHTEDYLVYLEEGYQKKKFHFTFDADYQLWEPYSSSLGDLHTILHLDQAKAETLMLLCDEEGKSRVSISPKADQAGARDTYSEMVKYLKDNFGPKGYNVEFFVYDWRLDNRNTARELEDFINEKAYTEIVLVCHSMGGLVASEYLNRSEANRNKVDKLITLGTPYLGAPKALSVMENGNFLGFPADTVMAGPLKAVVNNIPGIYQLLPSEQYFDLNNTTYVEYYNNNGFWGAASREKLNYDKTTELLSSRDWAVKSDNVTKKPMLQDAIDFADDLFINDTTHIISTVDAYLIIGYAEDTIMEVREEFNKDGTFNKCKDLTILNGGDGTVPLISANIGGLAPEGRTYYIIENHTGLVENTDVLNLVSNIINDNANTYNREKITTIQPEKINGKGWFSGTSKKIKIRIECPVTLSMIDYGQDEPWAYVSEDLIYNRDSDRGSFYVLGADNDIKIGYMEYMEHELLLTGTDDGTMDYTVSLFDAGYETVRVFFDNVPITDTIKIYTDTNIEGGIRLNLDSDGDGTIDEIISPTKVYEGTDLENEIEEVFNNYEVTCEVADQWPGAFNAAVTIKNVSDRVIDNWSLGFTMPHEIINIWNGTIAEHQGENYIIKNSYYNQDIAPGESVSFGFTAASSGQITLPENYYMHRQEVTVDSKDYLFGYKITSDWSTACTGEIIIKNISDNVIEDWILEFDFPYNIQNFYTAEIVSRDGDHYVVKNMGYNANIMPGEELRLGLYVVPGNALAGPENITLKQIMTN